jgi:hypothetical protein
MEKHAHEAYSLTLTRLWRHAETTSPPNQVQESETVRDERKRVVAAD